MTESLYRNPSLIRYGNFVFRHRNMMFPLVLAVLLVAFPPVHPEPGERWDFLADLAAVLVALAGEAVRVLTVGLEYIKRGGLNRRVYADRLVTHGLFAHCRNPLYVGNIALSLALLSIPDRPELFLIGGVLVILTYIAIVAAEEEYLRRTFGAAFDAYARRVNRWVPDPRGLRATLSSMRFNWRRVLLKESSSFYAWIVMAWLLDGFEIRFTDIPAQTGFLIFLALFLLGSTGFAAIRVLKRARILRLDP